MELLPCPSRYQVVDGLRQAADQLAAGSGGCVVVRGEAGIGKTTALHGLAEQVQQRGGDVLWSDVSYGTATATRAWRPPAQDTVAAESRIPFSSSAEELLEGLSVRLSEAPVLLVMDDVHWADPVTLNVLSRLRPGARGLPLLVALALRRVPSTAAVLATLARLRQDGAAVLDLVPLLDAELPAFVAQVTSSPATTALLDSLQVAGGNPYYLIQLLARAGASPPSATVLPPAALLHLQGLSLAARQVLTVAAVLGRDARVDEVAAMLGTSREHLLDELDELVDAGVLSVASRVLAVRHGLLRESVLESLPGSVLTGLRREAVGVRLSGADPGARLPLQVLPPGESLAARPSSALHELAAELSVRPAVSAPVLERVRLEVRGAGPQQLALRATLLPFAGGIEEAGRLLSRQLPQTSAESSDLRRLRSAVVVATASLSDIPAALDLLDGALAQEDLDRADRGLLLACRTAILVASLGPSAALPSLALAADAVDGSTGIPASTALAYAQGYLDLARGRSRAARQHFQAAEGLHAREPSLLGEMAGLLRWWPELALGNFDRVRDGLQERHDLAEGYRDVLAGMLRELDAALHLELGQLGQAVMAADPAVLDDSGQPISLQLRLQSVLVDVAVRRGRLAYASDLLGPWRRMTARERTTEFRYLAWAPVALAAARPSPDLAVMVREAADSLTVGLDLLVRSVSRGPTLVRALLLQGDTGRADQVVAAARALSAATPAEGTRAAALHSEGLLHDDPEALSAAVAAWRQDRRPLALADALLDLACATGVRRGEAAQAAREAHDIYRGRGALGGQERARHCAGERGVVLAAGPGRRHSGVELLTVSERKVAELVAAALSNREIAARLFLSPHTVDSHLRRIFDKLEIHSRVELGQKVAANHRSETDSGVAYDGDTAPDGWAAPRAGSAARGAVGPTAD